MTSCILQDEPMKATRTPVPRLLAMAIVQRASELWRVPVYDLLRPGRPARIVEVRFAVYAALAARGYAATEIAAAILGGHRGAVVSGIARASELAAIDSAYSRRLSALLSHPAP
jgi:hypothetical protein